MGKTKTKTKTKNKAKLNPAMPLVSICTPTFNRRPFIPSMIKCFNHQTYPKDKIEWIIIDDGTDKIEDLLKDVPQIKYFKYDEKMSLGKKRNLMHEKCKGDIIIYFDDDDYYPPERIQHAVETLLNNPQNLCAGSSIMHIFFKHINKMYRFGPYGPNHATAATFAFRKELLQETSFQDEACLAEERMFLKNWTIPMVQLDNLKTILVVSHNHNSFDKKELLKQNLNNNPYITLSSLTPGDFIKDDEMLTFFTKDIDEILHNYNPGHPSNKPDVLLQIDEITKKREQMQQRQENQDHQVQQMRHIQSNLHKHNQTDQMTLLVQELKLENNNLKDKVKYLEDKLKTLIQERIKEKQLSAVPIQ